MSEFERQGHQEQENTGSNPAPQDAGFPQRPLEAPQPPAEESSAFGRLYSPLYANDSAKEPDAVKQEAPADTAPEFAKEDAEAPAPAAFVAEEQPANKEAPPPVAPYGVPMPPQEQAPQYGQALPPQYRQGWNGEYPPSAQSGYSAPPQGGNYPPPYYGAYPPPQGAYPYPPPPPPYYNAGAGQGGYRYDPQYGWQPVSRSPQVPAAPFAPPEAGGEFTPHEYDTTPKKPPKRARRGTMVFLTCAALVIALAAGLWPVLEHVNQSRKAFEDRGVPSDSSASSAEAIRDPERELEITAKPAEALIEPLIEGRMTIPQVAKRVSPSVVAVLQYENTGMYYEAIGMGSGIIMTEDGYIITNAHVVEQGSEFKVELHDGTAYDAQVVGYDSPTDLALLKINAEGLHAAEFGDSTALEVGETVVAIGNSVTPEFSGSVTRGIVSALDRKIQTSTYEMTFIQTDAAINPGNSGGALANEFGQVVGINTSKITGEGYEGIGFAIPISNAKPILDDILQNGRVTGRVRLGITVQTVDEINARKEDIPLGLMIVEIDEAADIARRGVLTYDIITHVDGTRVYTHSNLRAALELHQAGDAVELTIYRRLSPTRAEELVVQVRLMEDTGR